MSIIETVIIPKEKNLGDDFIVRRSLPSAQKRMVGPFIFWDHMGPVKFEGDNKLKVRAHPHIGLATITYLFSGQIMHRDSLGNEIVIRPGEVNWMTAGRGIAHSERSPENCELDELEGIQLWLALPKQSEYVEASFVHHKEKDLPFISKNGTELRLIAGNALGHSSPIPTYSDLFYINAHTQKDSHFEFQLKENQDAAIYVIKGKLNIENEEFDRYNLIVFKAGSKIKLWALEDSQYMIFGGEIMPEGRHIWWNFVASDEAMIKEAKFRWKNNQFGDVINEDEIIPLPES